MDDRVATIRPQLDRTQWDQPPVAIVVTHYNYSHYLKDCLLSAVDQTYPYWECVVVDDASEDEHYEAAVRIVEAIGDPRIRIIRTESNLRQIGAFYTGVDATTAEFVCLLDPDDRWMPTFLDEMVAAHLNDTIFTSLVSCDQKLTKNDRVITGTYRQHSFSQLPQRPPIRIEHRRSTEEPMFYFPSYKSGWHWSTSSALMFRRDALNLVRPPVPLNISSADSYVARGLHMLAGTLFLPRALVYRGVHSANEALTECIIGTGQSKQRVGIKPNSPFCQRAVIKAMLHNKVLNHISERQLTDTITSHLTRHEVALIAQECPEVRLYWKPKRSQDRWRRRLRRLFGWPKDGKRR